MYTPRNLRKSTRPNKSGPGKAEKSRAFRFAKRWSDKFIHQSASTLEENNDYLQWCHSASVKQRLRK